MSNKTLYRNQAQIDFILQQSKINVLIWGRGTGKTESATSHFLAQCVLELPCSVGGLIVPTYAGASKIMEGVYKGFAELGLRKDLHYVVNKRPPHYFTPNLKAPADNEGFKHYISFYNGSGFYILSSETGHNGASLDFLAVEEARFVSERMFKETVLTVRGDKHLHNHYCHHSILLVSDMPANAEQMWLLRQYVPTTNVCSAIKALTLQAMKIESNLLNYASKTAQDSAQRLIRKLHHEANELRKSAVYVGKADSLTNVAVLGIETIESWRKNLTESEFRRSVLNEQQSMVDNAFYTNFRESYHHYSTGHDLDSPLEIGLDYNHKISCMVIRQSKQTPQGRIDYVIDALHVLEPYHLSDLVDKFCEKYHHHRHKELIYYHDSNSHQGRSANNSITYSTTVLQRFEYHSKTGVSWKVSLKNMGRPTMHSHRYEYFLKVFGEKQEGLLKIRFHSQCKDLALSLSKARTKLQQKGALSYTVKDKSDETKTTVPAVEATHFSEAFDSFYGREIKAMFQKNSKIVAIMP